MKHKLISLLLTIIVCYFTKVNAQIGAEAQGGKATMWAAIGIDQALSEKWTSVTDYGYGRHSDPDNTAFAKRLGLNVLSQDFIYKANTHWSYFFSIGYWRRNFYADDAPYDAQTTPYTFRNEIRPYQKIIYSQQVQAIKISHALRTDERFYYNQHLNDRWPTPFEFRLRYMETWKIPLSQNKKNWFIAVDEVLTAVDYNSAAKKAATGKQWSPYQFTENRFSAYYRRSLLKQKIDLDFGIMHQYWRDRPGVNTFNVSYNLMFDIIFYDPFSRKAKESAPAVN